MKKIYASPLNSVTGFYKQHICQNTLNSLLTLMHQPSIMHTSVTQCVVSSLIFQVYQPQVTLTPASQDHQLLTTMYTHAQWIVAHDDVYCVLWPYSMGERNEVSMSIVNKKQKEVSWTWYIVSTVHTHIWYHFNVPKMKQNAYEWCFNLFIVLRHTYPSTEMIDYYYVWFLVILALAIVHGFDK